MKRIALQIAAAFGAVTMFTGSARADYTLDHDEDWRDVPTLSGTIDLAGHKLTVSSLKGDATITSAAVTGYELLEYIDSDGSAYVNTEVKVAGNTVLDIKLQLRERPTGFASYVGARPAGVTTGTFGGWFYQLKHHRDADEPTTPATMAGTFADAVLNTDYLVHLDKSGDCTINGGAPFAKGSGKGNDLPIFVFGMNQGGSVSYRGNFRVYSCTIKYGDVPQRDLRPARRLPDGALGLLDVKDPEQLKFYENAGSGAFTAGRVVSEEFVHRAELHVDVADGETTENATVAISGQVRVVKDGAGTFVATRQNQAYTGGTVVSDGTFRCGTYGYNHIYGADGSTVTVCEGATFDCDGWAGHANFNFILDGGAVKNETDRSFAGYEILEYIDSDGNSYVDTGVTVDPSTVLDIRLQYLAKSGNTFASYVGARPAGVTTGTFGGWFVNSSSGMKHYRDIDEPTTNLQFGDVALNRDYLVHLEKSGGCMIDGEQERWTGGGTGNNLPIFIFGMNQGGSVNYLGKYRVYFCTIKYGNVVQCDLRPARRLSDGALGLLDVKDVGAANPKFCEKKGSGAFTAGPRADRSWFGDMTLTKDSTLTGRGFGFSRPDWAESTLRMNDKTLTLEMTDGGVIQAGNLKVEGGGEIYAEEGGWLLLGGNPQTGDKYVRAGTTRLRMGDAAIRDVGGELVFGSYVSEYTGGSDEANSVIKVQGRFTPGTKWHATELQDGATLDLSECAGTWNTTCAFADSGTTATATFAAGATVTVDLGARAPTDRMKLVGWADAPLSTVTFRLSDAISSDNYMLERRTDGVYIMAAVKTATWTGAAGTTDCDNPANWDCRNAKGEKLDGARPGSITDVTVSGAVQFGIPASSMFSCASFTCDNVSLAGNCDWSGLGQPIDGLIDLAGHNLIVSSLKGGATITDSTEEPNLIQDGSFEAATIPVSPRGGGWAYFGDGVTSSCWQTPNSSDRVGITKNGEPWTAWVSGTQAALVQCEKDRDITLQQEVEVPEDGKYLLKYYYVWRPATHNSQRLEIHVDDGPVCGYTDSGASVAVKEIVLDLTKGPHTIKFVGTTPYNNNATTIIDDVSLRRICPAGELHVVVPEGRTEENSTVAISGSVCLVKDGAGTFVAKKQGQAYRGGTDVAAGTFRCGAFGNACIYGAAGSTVTVREGATFDCNGNAEHGSFSFVLDGGTVQNMTDLGYANYSWFADMTLTKDSLMTGGGFGFIRPSWAESTLRMNGHVLTVSMVGGNIHAGNLTVEGGGEIYLQEGGWFLLGGNSRDSGKYVRAETTTLHMGGGGAAINDRGGEHVFGSYVSEYTGPSDISNTVIKVLNRFVPGVKWHATELQDGATLDLSACTDTWDTTCDFNGSGRTATATFAEGATIVVDLGERKVKSSKPVITWNEKPENVKFCAAPGTAGRFVAKDDGLYCHIGFSVIIR